MTDVIILGAAHPHIQYALAEVEAAPDLRIVAAAEPDAQARERFLADLSVPVYDDPRTVLETHSADVAVICGVYSRRADHIVDCLQRGIAVLADKPICTDEAQLDAIERAAATASVPLAVMFDKRFYPETLALFDLVAAGELGELVSVASSGPHKLLRETRPGWFFERETYGSIAADLLTHDIDILLQLTGPVHGQVATLAGNRMLPDRPEFDDHATALIQAGPVQASLEASWLQPERAEFHGDYRMRVVGTAGTAEVDWARHRLTVTTHQSPERVVEPTTVVRPLQFFFDALRQGRTPEVTATQSITVTRVALAAQDSARNDGAWRRF